MSVNEKTKTYQYTTSRETNILRNEGIKVNFVNILVTIFKATFQEENWLQQKPFMYEGGGSGEECNTVVMILGLEARLPEVEAWSLHATCV